MRQVAIVVGAVIILVGVALGAFFGGRASVQTSHEKSSPRTTVTSTSVVVYEPFISNGVASGIEVASTVRGYCWTDSLAVARQDAYRCLSGNDIYDPCFSNPYGLRQVACPLGDPDKIVLITVTKALPTNSFQAATTPWLFELANGEICGAVTGATFVVDGLRANGECGKSGWWFGNIDQRSRTWSVLVQAPKSSELVRTSIIRAWE